jgi:protein-disulfide isomerase
VKISSNTIRTVVGATANVALAVCAVIVTTLVVRREVYRPMPRPVPSVTIQRDWRAFTTAGHLMGPEEAKTTIVEFADFECPYCKRLDGELDSLRRLGLDFRVLYRHFPISSHRFALVAARVSECASQQHRFAEMHHALFAFSDSMGLVPWAWYASRAKVRDTIEFSACVKSAAPIPALAADTVAARQLAIGGTPLLLIDSLRIPGAPSIDSLVAYVTRSASEHIR